MSYKKSLLIYFFDRIKPIIEQVPLIFYRKRKKSFPFSSSFLPMRRSIKKIIKQMDIIHLNWIVHGFMNIEFISSIKSPIVWTLHDSWAFTGGCHIPKIVIDIKILVVLVRYLDQVQSLILQDLII